MTLKSATLKSIVLELARNPGAPEGDPSCRYEFRAPLQPDGSFDAAAWREAKDFCTVRRIEKGEVAETGVLARTQGGRFVFSYRPGDEDDEPVFRFASHIFSPGEYVTVTEHDGIARTFRVADVADWNPAAETGHESVARVHHVP